MSASNKEVVPKSKGKRCRVEEGKTDSTQTESGQNTKAAKKQIVLDDNGDFTCITDVPWEVSRKHLGLFFEFATDINVHNSLKYPDGFPKGLRQGADAAESLLNLKTW
jgi:hypothetical protein